ncbi:hypothetical protein PQR05_29355 [Paraburkholderia sediminicola]|uniref:hypothetical protein n=1 Tax=Paraburkholderia sediminicola TaxID=458836 RepID=UPI0038BD71A4
MLKYNTFAGATATAGSAENMKLLKLDDLKRSVNEVYPYFESWEEQFQAFALQHGCDLEANGIMLLPSDFDVRDIPPRYLDKQVRINPTLAMHVVFLRNPYAAIPDMAELPAEQPEWPQDEPITDGATPATE